MKITAYGKPDCCLCDKALEVLEAFARERPVEIEKIDISKDPALTERYGVRIPVVAIDGTEYFEYKVGPVKLRRIAAEIDARRASS